MTIIGGIGTGVVSKVKGQFMQSIEVRAEYRNGVGRCYLWQSTGTKTPRKIYWANHQGKKKV